MHLKIRDLQHKSFDWRRSWIFRTLGCFIVEILLFVGGGAM
jgi:hypothetical protein